MSNLSDIKQSKFLKKEDVGAGKLVTITKITKENVGTDDEPELKYCAHFKELPKPLALNSTNAQIIAKISGSDQDIEETWVGASIVLFDDPNVSFKGELVGGIRVRAPKTQAQDLPF